AGEGARFSACSELTIRFRGTGQREQPYLTGEALALAEASDLRRRAAFADLQAVHQALAAYLRTLAALAGEETFDVSAGLGQAASGIQAHAEYGLGAEHAAAYASLCRVTATWVSAARQERSVREMLKAGDPCVQVLLDGLASLVRCFKQTSESERRTVLGRLEVEIPFADTSDGRLLAVLARAHAQALRREYDQVAARCDDAAEGIRSLQAGHRRLLEGAGRLSRAELAAALGTFTKDLRTIRKRLRTLDQD
ncbi:MAG TPA: hypothetical protein VN436_06985, partial [Holophaga sp.]|nr:hypothetical protein [Holophaga sp.]